MPTRKSRGEDRRGQPLTYDISMVTEGVSRPPRIEFAGAVHHVMARGDRREEIFRDDRDRWKFLGISLKGRNATG